MSWFNRHPNWVIFIVWALMNWLGYWAVVHDNLALIIVASMAMIGTLAWSLKVKRRSLFYLFCLLIPYLGILIIWMIDSSKPKVAKSENVQSSGG